MARDTKSKKNTFINNVIWYAVGIFDYLNTSAIYSGYVTPALLHAFQQSFQFIFFPIYAINTAIYVVLALANLFFDRDKDTKKIKTENIVRLCVNILSALIVGTAVIGALAFAATMGIVTTILFALNLALTGIYNFVGAGYHIYQFVKKGRALKNSSLSQADRERLVEERKAHVGSIIGYLVVGTTVTMVALAGGLAMLGGFLPLAAIGIAAGVIGAGFCAFALYNEIRKRRHESKMQNDNGSKPPLKPESKPNSTLTVVRHLCNGLTHRITDFAKTFRFTQDNNPTHRATESGSKRLGDSRPLLQTAKITPSHHEIKRRRF